MEGARDHGRLGGLFLVRPSFEQTPSREFSASAFDEHAADVERRLRLTSRALELRPSETAASEKAISAFRGCPVVIVPGAFHREYPKHGANGERLEAAMRELGFSTQRVELPSFCSVQSSAKLIADWLSGFPGGPVLLLSLSKGGTDTLESFAELERRGIAPESRVRLWISIGGLLFGTPAVDAIKRERLRYLYVRWLFHRRGYALDDLGTLSRSARACTARQILERLTVPSYHVVGFPRYADLSSNMARRSARRTWEYGASDGGGIPLDDYLSYRGTLVPAFGQDHYFRNLPVREVIATILSEEASKGLEHRNRC